MKNKINKNNIDKVRERYNPYSIPIYAPYCEIYPKITIEDYYKATKGLFKRYKEGNQFKDLDQIEEDWNGINAPVTDSPNSSSKYKTLGDTIYRLSDHWDRVASCYWELEDKKEYAYYDRRLESRYQIGYIKISDLAINEDATLMQALDKTKIKDVKAMQRAFLMFIEDSEISAVAMPKIEDLKQQFKNRLLAFKAK